MAGKTVEGKALIRILHEGQVYKPNEIVVLEEKQASVFVKEGSLDLDNKAVAHSKKEGFKPIKHAASKEYLEGVKEAKLASDREDKIRQDEAKRKLARAKKALKEAKENAKLLGVEDDNEEDVEDEKE